MFVVRFILRLPLLLLHLFIGIPLTVITFNPLGRRIKCRTKNLDELMLTWWSGTLCRIFGLKRRIFGRLQAEPMLVVANHISWLDIQLLHSLAAMSFVGKAEIGRWPVMGWLAKAGGTVFHERGSHGSSNQVAETMIQRMQDGHNIAIFPEGGILPGEGVARFHARLFRVAVDSGCSVQPIAIRFTRNGKITNRMTFLDGENFLMNLIRLLGEPTTMAELHILSPLSSRGFNRRDLAELAHAAVAAAYQGSD